VLGLINCLRPRDGVRDGFIIPILCEWYWVPRHRANWLI